jgi:FdhE protein
VRRVGAALERVGGTGEGSAGEAARTVVAALDRAFPSPADADALAAAALAGEWDAARDLARRLDVDEDALVTLLDYAARGALRAAGARVRALLERRAAAGGTGTRTWERGVCPACGAPPVLAELRGKEQGRTLRCARCDGAWAFARLACPACGERDHRKLLSLSGEGEEGYRRADCCDTCRTYVKAVATLAPLSAEALLETDLATAALDMIAVERGYHR